MNDKDRTILGIGAVVALIVLAGAAVLEGEAYGEGGGLYSVIVKERDPVSMGNDTGNCDEGESQENVTDIQADNLLKIEFILTWDDDWDGSTVDQPDQGPDEFSLRVEMGNISEQHSSTSEEIIISFDDLNEKPDEKKTYDGDSEDDVKEELKGTNGKGNYTVTITCEDDGEDGLAEILNNEDNGNSYNLEIRYTYYELDVGPTDTSGK